MNRVLEGTDQAQLSGRTGIDVQPSFRQMATLYAPLAFGMLMMVVEPSVINAGMARAENAEVALAGYVAVFGIAVVIAAPSVMILDTAIAQATDRRAFVLVRRFAILVGLFMTTAGMLVAFTPLYDVITRTILGLPWSVTEASRSPLRILVLWPAPIVCRRLYQGLLIRAGRTGLIALGTAIRLAVLTGGLAIGLQLLPDRGMLVGACSMECSVVAEAIVVRLAAAKVVTWLPAKPEDNSILTLLHVWHFYWPLAVSTIMNRMTKPVVTAGIAALPLAQRSLAAWSVVWSLSFVVAGPAESLQQFAVALVKDAAALRQACRFSTLVGGGLSLLLGALACTPLGGPFLGGIFNLAPDLIDLALPALRTMTMWPLLMGLRGLLAGTLIQRGRTAVVGSATVVNLATTVVVVLMGIWLRWLPGAVLGAGSTLVSCLAEIGWLCAYVYR